MALDPGHGGEDPGAIGRGGSYEKNVTLSIARRLKRKIDAGASSAITQFFFNADTFFRFRDACVKAGIDAPIIPGILPIQSWAGTKRFAARCGARVPAKLDEAFATAARDGREALLALAQCTALCDRLMAGGVEDLHFYTLNRPQLVREVVRALLGELINSSGSDNWGKDAKTALQGLDAIWRLQTDHGGEQPVVVDAVHCQVFPVSPPEPPPMRSQPAIRTMAYISG